MMHVLRKDKYSCSNKVANKILPMSVEYIYNKLSSSFKVWPVFMFPASFYQVLKEL